MERILKRNIIKSFAKYIKSVFFFFNVMKCPLQGKDFTGADISPMNNTALVASLDCLKQFEL